MRKISTLLAVVAAVAIPAIANSETTTYAYDALGRMVGVVVDNGGITATTTSIYAYDSAGNRQWMGVNTGTSTKIPVFRFHGGSQHFYTTSYIEGQRAGLVSDGAQFNLSPTGGSGLVALYRCYASANNDHFLSGQSDCEGQGVEGIIGYAYLAAGPNLVALYRFNKASIYDHLITVNYQEGIGNGYSYEGILGYVPI
jgi:YD repeat-containing protein